MGERRDIRGNALFTIAKQEIHMPYATCFPASSTC